MRFKNEKIKYYLSELDKKAFNGYLGIAKDAFKVLVSSLKTDKTKSLIKILSNVQKPIIVGGCERSGTTLMVSILSAHPNIYVIPRETGAFMPGRGPFGYKKIDSDNGKPFNIFKIYHQILEDENYVTGKRWCEKTPKNIHFAKRVIEYFEGGARFINMVRDGRSVVTSKHVASDENWVSPEQWVTDVEAGRELEDHPQVLTVRYEDLTDDYMGVLRRVCSFVDEPFAKTAFENYPETGKTLTLHHGSREPRAVQPRTNERWKSSEHAEVVEELLSLPKAVDHLKYYGYID